MNELVDIVNKLCNKYSSEFQWEVVKAERVDNFKDELTGWTLTIQPMATAKNGGAENESNE